MIRPRDRETPRSGLARLDRLLERLPREAILGLASGCVLLVGIADHLTGYELSVSLLYLGPVAAAAWYAGRWPGLGIAVLSCLGWYVADRGAGHQYSHAAIPVWNALVRLGLFSVTSFLTAALRESLLSQRRLAQTDGLTDLFSRRAFLERLEHDVAMAQRREAAVTIAYLDLDDFKAVNDTYGHAAGDRVLRTTALALKGSIRQTDTAARLGGDEFALLLPDTDQHGAKRVIGDLSRELAETFAADGWKVSGSVGAVTFHGSSFSATEMIAAADALMYEVKRSGKGAVSYRVFGDAPQSRSTPDAPQVLDS